MSMGQRIKALRKNNKLTLEGLAKKVGSSKGYIWELENNDNANPSVKLIKGIADALGVTIDYLMSGIAAKVEETTYWYINSMHNETSAARMAVTWMQIDGHFNLEEAYKFLDSINETATNLFITDWKEITKADFDYLNARK